MVTESPTGWKLAPSDGQADLTRLKSPAEVLDWNAFEIKTHGIVWRIINDETCRWAVEWNDRCLFHSSMRLIGECHR